MMAAAGSIDDRYGIAAIRAPHSHDGGGYAWFSLGWDSSGIRYNVAEAKNSLDLLLGEIEALAEETDTRPERLIIGGFSQGATMSLAVLLHRPSIVGGAVLMSGALLPELLPEQVDPRPELPILVQHGLSDPVLPVHLGRAVRDLLRSLGFRPDYREYDMAHQVSLESLRDIEDWLSSVVPDAHSSK